MNFRPRWTGTGRGGTSSAAAARRPERFAAALAVACALIAACAGLSKDDHPAPGAQPIVFETTVEHERSAYDPRVQAGMELLAQAVEAGDDELALLHLERLRGLEPGPELTLVLEKYALLLEGRRLSRSIRLGLALESGAGSADAAGSQGPLRLLLTVRHDEPQALRLRFHPLELRELTTAVRLVPLSAPGLPGASRLDAIEQRATARRAADVMPDLVLEPGQIQVIDLGLWHPPSGGALAVRHYWKLESRSGTVDVGGERYPVNHLAPATAEAVRLAPWLPAAAVPPADWLSYALGAEPSQAALMERAVRIELGRQGEALDLLTAELEELPGLRMQALVPALRWLARTSAPGGDGKAWTQWLRARERQVPAAPDADSPAEGGLDLPLTAQGSRAE